MADTESTCPLPVQGKPGCRCKPSRGRVDADPSVRELACSGAGFPLSLCTSPFLSILSSSACQIHTAWPEAGMVLLIRQRKMTVLENNSGVKVKGRVEPGQSLQCAPSVEMGVVSMRCLHISTDV